MGEHNACECLLKEKWKHLCPNIEKTEATIPANTNKPCFASSFAKQMKANKCNASTAFKSKCLSDVSWISPITVIAEQLFLKCGHIMTVKRQWMHPQLFEAIIFLKQNREWWDDLQLQQMGTGLWDKEPKNQRDECGKIAESNLSHEDENWQ